MSRYCNEDNIVAVFKVDTGAAASNTLNRLEGFYPEVTWNGGDYPFRRVRLDDEDFLAIHYCDEREDGKFRMKHGLGPFKKVFYSGKVITDVDTFLDIYFGDSNCGIDFEPNIEDLL